MKYDKPVLKDNERFYKEKLRGKISDIRDMCNDSGIPCIMLFATKPDKESDFHMELEFVLPEFLGLHSDNTVFADLINILNGFRAVPKAGGEVTEVDVADEFYEGEF